MFEEDPELLGDTVGALVRDLASVHGDRPAAVDAAGSMTYEDLDRRSALLARRLLADGVTKGTRVGILLPNSAAWLTWFTAITRIGAVALPLSTLAKPPELAWLLANAGVDRLICADRYLGHDYQDRLERALPSLESAGGDGPLLLGEAPRLRRIVVRPDANRPWATDLPAAEGIDDDLLRAIEATVRVDDPVVVIHTSGSTADPKGVVHTHGALVGHTRRMATDYALARTGDRFASPRPWFWVAGLAADLFYVLQAGATFVVPATTDAEQFAEQAQREGIDIVGGPFPWFRELAASPAMRGRGMTCVPLGIDAAGIAHASDGSPTRFTSDALEARVAATDAAAFDLSRLPNLFGMTETLGSHSGLPHGTLVPAGREGTSGPPLPGVERRVVDPVTGVDVAAGEEGELLVRGASLMLGLDRAPRSETLDPDGWYATGDVCRLDPDGWITFRSRLGDMVKISGANVAPLEVERALGQHDVVGECAVVGVDRSGSPSLVAAVIAALGARPDEDELVSWLGERLSSYKVPRTVVVLEASAMPRRSSGKIDRRALTELLASMTEPTRPTD